MSMPTSVSAGCRPVTVTVPRIVPGVALWKRASSVPLRSATIGTPRDRTATAAERPANAAPTWVAAPVVRSIVCSRVVPPIVSVAKATPSLAVMSKPTSSPVSTPSGPTGTSVPAFGGFWISS